ncbi:DUF3857 domain-containing protein [Catenovulum sp. 2E275]|uniref:DUF3857 domain-containing protein n=1 Tax=Catenovulum sp. 2E275 TaxID=2980497 RepID=UPI0021D1BDAA|nr:DUF3857 domain-containing protein [Catenovulum sp. 2E275]MCU4677220.1 DUF3857 domain-containing protein [Catenovulum sp. 2E275]
MLLQTDGYYKANLKVFLNWLICILPVCLGIAVVIFVSTAQATGLEKTSSIERLAPPLAKQNDLMTQSEQAEVLYSQHKIAINSNGELELTHYYSIRVLTEQAASDYQLINLPFNSDLESISLDFAHIYQPENTQQNNTQTTQSSLLDISDQVLVAQKTISDEVRFAAFNRPEANQTVSLFARALKAQQILEFQYKVTLKQQVASTSAALVISPYWIQSVWQQEQSFNRIDPVQNYQLTLELNTNTPFSAIPVAGHSLATEREAGIQPNNMTTWQMNNLPELKSGGFAFKTNEYLTQLVLLINDAAAKNVNPKPLNSAQSETEQAALNSIIALFEQVNPKSEFKDKTALVKAIFEFIQNEFVYQPEPLSSSNYEAKLIANLFEQRFGNDKDLAHLAVNLLNYYGVEAQLAWLDLDNLALADLNSSRLNNNALYSWFDQAIVYLPKQSGLAINWLNPSSNQIFPGVPANWVGQNVWVFSTNQYTARTIKSNELMANSAVIKLDYLTVENNVREVKLLLELSGAAEQYFRRLAELDSDTQQAQTLIEKQLNYLFSEQAEFELTYQLDNLASKTEPLVIKASYLFNEADYNYSVGANVAQMFNLAAAFNHIPEPENAALGYLERSGFTVDLFAYFHGYPARVASLYQSSVGQHTPYYHLIQQGQAKGQDFELHFSFEQDALDLSAQAYLDYLAAIQQLTNLDSWLVSFRANPKAYAEQKLAQALNLFSQHSAEWFLAKAEFEFAQGNFESSLRLAQQVVDADPEHARGWYIVAVSAGLTGQTALAESAFNYAYQLGYSFGEEK